jgi:hypothetical protein
MVTVTDVERTGYKGYAGIRQGTHQQLAGASTRHNEHLRLPFPLALVISDLAARRQDAEMLRSPQDAYLHIHAIHAFEQAWF